MFLQNTTYDWRYYTESNSAVANALVDGRVYWPRGKMLGGSSAMNALLHVNGHQYDFDINWQNEVDSTWSWSSVSSYFDRLSSQTSNGKMNIENYPEDRFDTNARKMLENIFFELGYDQLSDINGKSSIGFGRSQAIMKNGERSSSAKAYLHSTIVGKRENLNVVKMAHVTRILFDENSKKVRGVEFIRTPEAKRLVARSSKEVILSAGAINTPQILMLSGIGPSNHLTEHKIPVICDLSGVGRNLQDHVAIPFVMKFNQTTAKPHSLAELAHHFQRYLFERRGMFANLGTTDFMGFIHTDGKSNHPNIQIMNFMIPRQSEAVMNSILFNRFNHEVFDELVQANLEADTIVFFITLLNPKSRGEIKLNSRDAFDAPKIFANYLTDEADVVTLAKAADIFYRITKTRTFRTYDGELVRFKLPDCEHLLYGSNAYWQCFARYVTFTLYHPVGTAKMTHAKDPAGVVDSKLAVRCVNGLRVADASM